MIISEHVRMALSSIRSARFRSFLTMLGIIIGVISVITIMSLGEGVKRQVATQSNSVGQDLITVRPGSLAKRDAQGKIDGINLLSFLSSSKITERDLTSIVSDPNVNVAVPMSILPTSTTYANTQYKDGFVMATNEKLPEVVNRKIEFGSFFKADDNERKVAVIGAGVAEKLFKENIPIGKSFQIRGQQFVVGGVFERFPDNPLSPDVNFNNGVFIPYGTGKMLMGEAPDFYEVLVRPTNAGQTDAAITSISNAVRSNHEGQDDFTVLRQEELASVANRVIHIVTAGISAMAAIALLVGGVGIMNVMLVSVTERTREIGIRKAVGATNRQIQNQFLIEAIVLSVWGAIIGVFGAGIINLLFRILTNFEPIITWQSVLLSTAASILVGVVFGFIPAVKAARKDPIESLRSY